MVTEYHSPSPTRLRRPRVGEGFWGLSAIEGAPPDHKHHKGIDEKIFSPHPLRVMHNPGIRYRKSLKQGVYVLLIGVMSDTHDNIDNIKKAVAAFNERRVSLVIHAGDITSPFSLSPLKDLTSDYVGIFGNNDGDLLLLTDRSGGKIHKQPYQFEHGGRRIVVMHEPDLIDALADSGHYDIVIYGHTHEAVVKKKKDVLIVNPGETGHWLYGRATVGVINTKTLDAQIITLE